MLSGCGILNPSIEFFKKKVPTAPEKSDRQKEQERQAAQYVKEQLDTAQDAAIRENASTNVIEPLNNAIFVIEPLSLSLGPPLHPWTDSATNLAKKLSSEQAKLNGKMEDYKKDLKPLENKTVDGTGLIKTHQWTILIGVVVGFFVLRFIISVVGVIYPPVGVAESAIRVSAPVVHKAFNEVLSGGELFLKKVESTIDDPKIKQQVINLFKDSHMISQSPDTQNLVKKLTA